MIMKFRDHFYLWRLKLLAKFKRKIIGQRVAALIVETEQGTFAIKPEDQEVGRKLLTEGGYDKEVIRKWQSFLSEDDRVLIVGGHIGSLAIPLSNKCRAIDVIEANPFTYKLLTYNKALNACHNMEIFHCAAAEKKGKLEFYANKVNSGGSKRKPKHDSYKYNYDNPDLIEVDTVVLDDLLAENKYKLIIMDIEGSEYFALQGMQKLLSMTECLQVEYLTHHLEEVAGVNQQQFFPLILPHFSKIEVPGRPILAISEFDYQNFDKDCDLVFYK